jgi:hypothetical protein
VYDEAKRFAESITMAYHRYHGLDTRIVRIFNTYGPRMRLDDGRVVPNFICQALNREPLTIYGEGLQTRSFCYVDDLVEGCCAPLGLQRAGERSQPPGVDPEFARRSRSGTRASLKPLPRTTRAAQMTSQARSCSAGSRSMASRTSSGDDRLLPHKVTLPRPESGDRAGPPNSHMVDAYVYAGHEVLVVDDLSTGNRESEPRRAFTS